VGDYCNQLLVALKTCCEEFDCDVNLFYKTDWSMKNFFRYVGEVRRHKPDVIYLQYPTEGYGYSLLPQLLASPLIGARRVVNLHEFKSKSAKGKFAILLFFLFGCSIVYTNQEEHVFATSILPRVLHRSSTVIRIGSNIPFQVGDNSHFFAVQFGLIRPKKGIECYIEVVRALRSAGLDRPLAFVGAIPANYVDYARSILITLQELGVELFVDLAPDQVATVLATSRFCVLPFDDGISERRGSVLAAMGNGCVVVGKQGQNKASDIFRNSVLYVDDLAQVAAVMMATPEARLSSLRDSARQFARQRDWQVLVRMHLNFLLGS
jgi:glycosyltransferase involved in cell wall biosynthesis